MKKEMGISTRHNPAVKAKASTAGITLVSLVVTIIILIILAGVSLNLTLGENGIITIAKQARENTELAKIEEETRLNELYTQIELEDGNLIIEGSSDDNEKINAFKKAIADYIEEAGGIKPEYTADTITFGESIKGILKEATKNATATADNISEGKTAYVNGELVIGNGNDNKKYYELGRNDVISTIYGKTSTQYTTGWDSSSTLSASVTSPTGYGSTTASKSGRSQNIYLAKTPNGENGYITSLNFDFASGCYGGGNSGNTKYTFYIYDANDNLITTWEYSGKSQTISVEKALMDYCITGDYIYIKYDAYLQANGFTDSVMAWTSATEYKISDTISLSYIV